MTDSDHDNGQFPTLQRVDHAPIELGLGGRPLPRVSIFMSVFDCHVNRSPVTGRIEEIVYHAGTFVSADDETGRIVVVSNSAG